MNILVTGATGNVGRALIEGLQKTNSPHTLITAGREKGKAVFRRLDFEDVSGFESALEGIDLVFLLRPPQVTQVKELFRPFFDAMKKKGVNRILFLSVQGADRQSFIPHARIEKLIREYGFEHVFLRPGYFMQNLGTTLFGEMKSKRRIYMPSGRLRFNWVDTADVGLAGAVILNSFERHSGKAYEITGKDFTGFGEVVEIINRYSDRKIRYVSPPVPAFLRYQRRKGVTLSMILVLLMLHYLPRWGRNPDRQSADFEILTGKEPSGLENYIRRELIPIIP